jgi:acetyl esterase/lipase
MTPIAAATQPAAARTPRSSSYALEKDISYRTGDNLPAYAKERCTLDIYYPTATAAKSTDGKAANAKSGDTKTGGFATVVWFHGGGMKSGNKSVPKALQEKGIAVVAVNYRLAPQAKSPEYIEDAAAAVAWTFNNIEKFGGSRKLIFVAGHSAGGYLTSMIGLDKRYLAAHQINADDIAGLIPFSGQAITHFTIRAERGVSDKQPTVDALAPLFHVRPDAPPMLILSGDRNKEMVGRYEENAYFWRMLKVVGHPDVELLELQGYDHGGMDDPGYPLLVRFVRERAKSAKQ